MPTPPPSTTTTNRWFTHTSFLLTSVTVVLPSLLLPPIIRLRDDLHHRPPYRSNENIASLGACAGNVTIPLSLKNKHGDVGGGDDEVRLFYLTTTGRCGGEKQKKKPLPKKKKKGHVLLIHGTAMSSRTFTDGPLDIPNHDDTVWNILHEKYGYDVTAIDLRGHGLSGRTTVDGPYKVDELGNDVALFLETLLNSTKEEEKGNEKVHCLGHSIGFGTCMSLSVHRPDLVSTIVGSGFLFDHSHFDFLAYIFSREAVLRFMGMAVLAHIASMVFKEQHPGTRLRDWMHDTHMDVNVWTSSGWLHHNLTRYLSEHYVPTLYLVPEYDADVGHTPERTKAEIAIMPPGIGELVEFPGYSHMIFGETGGSKKTTEAAVEFMERRSSG